MYNNNPTPLGEIIFFSCIALLVISFIVRQVFSIPTIVKELKKHTNLLARIAKNGGSDIDDIQSSMNKIDGIK